MHARYVCFGVLLVLCCSCGDREPAPEPFDGTVTFFIESGSDDPAIISETTVTVLAAEKPGRTRLVDAWQDATPPGARHGRHTFPTGTTAIGVAAYYSGALQNAGWKLDVDFRMADGSIHFFGVGSLQAGADRSELQVTVSP